jgi:hypothetical protein
VAAEVISREIALEADHALDLETITTVTDAEEPQDLAPEDQGDQAHTQGVHPEEAEGTTEEATLQSVTRMVAEEGKTSATLLAASPLTIARCLGATAVTVRAAEARDRLALSRDLREEMLADHPREALLKADLLVIRALLRESMDQIASLMQRRTTEKV